MSEQLQRGIKHEDEAQVPGEEEEDDDDDGEEEEEEDDDDDDDDDDGDNLKHIDQSDDNDNDDDDDDDDDEEEDDDDDDNLNHLEHGSSGNQGPPPPHPYYSYPFAYPMPPPPYVAPPPADYLLTGPQNPHSYTDAAAMADPAPDTRRNRGGVTEPFPDKLHRMLNAVEREGLSDVVSFFSHGRAFAIHKTRRFVSEIMPRFFRQSRLTSFQRQLNLYGFRRISQGPDNGGYYHELFLKGRMGLCVNMKRVKVKGQHKLKRDPDTERESLFLFDATHKMTLVRPPLTFAFVPLVANFYAMRPISGSSPAPISPSGIAPSAGYYPPPYFPPPSYPPYTAAQNGTLHYPPYPYYNPYASWAYPPLQGHSPQGGMHDDQLSPGSPMEDPISPIQHHHDPESPDSSQHDETLTESL